MSRPRRAVRTSLGRSSASIWTEEVTFELLAWAEHCRRKDGSGKHFEGTVVRHLQTAVGVKLSYAQIDGKIRELAQSSTTPLAHLHYSYLYKTYGLESMIPCVINDRAARKAFQYRVNELSNNESSRPAAPKTTVAQGGQLSYTPLEKAAKIDGSKKVECSRRHRLTSRKHRGRRKWRTKASIPPRPSSFVP